MQCDLTEEEYLEEKSDILEAYEKAVEAVEAASEDYVTNRVDAAQAFESAKASYEQFSASLMRAANRFRRSLMKYMR